MRRWGRLLFAAVIVLVPAAFAARSSADAIDTVRAVERLFRQPVAADWFAPAFLAQVSADQVAAIIKQLTDKYGAFREVAGRGTQLTVRLERAEIPTFAALDENGRFTGLLLQTPIPTAGSLDDMVASIAGLPGTTSVLVLTNGETRAAHDPDAALAVGSAMKLAILAALDAAVAEKRLAFDQVVGLDPDWRTLPSSTLITWPAKTPVTIATLADFMISVSDNMATDGLIHLVGRAPIEAITPRNAPFLTTAELFKLQANPAALKTWLAADEAGRRALLPHLDALPLPRSEALAKHSTGAEWFLSARELCGLLDRVADSPALTINPGLANRGDWKSIAFKGGSDNGVLNLSTRVVAADGTLHCVVATWNGDGALPEETLAPLYSGILKQLRR
jgi:beta-lactamase class A